MPLTKHVLVMQRKGDWGKSSYGPSYCAPTIRVVCVSWRTDMQRLARKVGRVKHWKLQAGLILQNNRKEGGRLLRKFLMLHWQRRRPTKCAPIGWCAIFPGTQPRQLRAEFPLLTSRVGSGHGTLLKLGPRITQLLRHRFLQMTKSES